MRDEEARLPACIASLEAQTVEAWEVVAVDDGSADGTPDLLAAWARRDGRVRVLTTGRRGIVAALETAREAGRAPVLARMDADDVAHPERLAAQLELLEARPEVALCGCLVRYVPRERVQGGARRYEAWINGLRSHDQMERDLFVECPLAHPTFVMRARAVASVGGYRDRGWPEDYDLVLRLWEAGARFAKVPRVLLEWTEGADRLSRHHPSYAPEAFRRCKVEVLRRTLLREREGVVVWGAGPTGKAFARTLNRAGQELRAFVDLDPRKIGQEIHGAPVVAPDGVEAFRGAFCVGAVGQAGAREEIREALRGRGWEELRDFCAVA